MSWLWQQSAKCQWLENKMGDVRDGAFLILELSTTSLARGPGISEVTGRAIHPTWPRVEQNFYCVISLHM